jgi:hypothetical protein
VNMYWKCSHFQYTEAWLHMLPKLKEKMEHIVIGISTHGT